MLHRDAPCSGMLGHAVPYCTGRWRHIYPLSLTANIGKRAILSTAAAEEAVKALGEDNDVLLLNALKLVASIAAHPGTTVIINYAIAFYRQLPSCNPRLVASPIPSLPILSSEMLQF